MRSIFVVMTALVSFQLAAAEDTAQTSADEKAIRRAVQSYVAAFNAGDAKALAAHWSQDGVYTNRTTGQQFSGREAIEAEFEILFSHGQSARLDVSLESIRFVTPDVAVEEGTAYVVESGQLPSPSRYTAIYVKRDGEWRLDSVRETAMPATPSHYEYLSDLEWMIGDWIDQDENATIQTTCQWTANRNFMTRSFAVSVQDRIELRGTQVIGWDPVAQQVRSWVFDTDGGFGEGAWSREGNRWIIKTNSTLQGGRKASTVNIITFVDDDTFTWQSIGREVDGELLPNIDEVTVVRMQSTE